MPEEKPIPLFFKDRLDRFHPKIWSFIELIRLDKPIGIYLLLWPTAWALWIAGAGAPGIKLTLIFFAGVILMRSAGCAINDFADRHIDGLVNRTKTRPIVSGAIKSWEALACAAVLVLVAFILVLQVNRLTVYWSMGALLIASIYPFMKRYTHLPQVVLGAAFAWSVPMAFSALNYEVTYLAWLIYSATVFWTIAYDTMYAMVDRQDDLKIGVKSTAILFGSKDKHIIALFQVCTLLLLIVLGQYLNYSWLYYFALAAGAGLFIYQQSLLKTKKTDNYFLAFKNNHWFGLLVFIGIASQYFY